MKTIQHIFDAIKNILSATGTEFRMVLKDQGVLMFLVIAPLLYPIVYGWIYNYEVVRNVPIAVVDMSKSHESREFLRMCDASPDVSVAYHCTNIEEAQELIGRQKAHGAVFIPSDFAHRIHRKEQANVSLYCDMSMMLYYKAIYQTVQNVTLRMSSAIQTEHGLNLTKRDEEISTHPIDIAEVPIFNPTGGYGNFLLPAVLMVVIQQMLLLGIGMVTGTMRERRRKGEVVYGENHSVMEIILGKTLCYFTIFAVESTFLTLGITRFYNLTSLASPIALIALLVPYILACIFFAIVFSSIIRYRENVILVVVFTSLLFLFMSGISWPTNNIPAFWQGVSWIAPSTFGINGFLKINSMGASLSDIRTDCAILWLQATIYFILSCIGYGVVIRKEKREKSEE